MLRLFGVDRVKALSAKGRSMFPTGGGGRGSTQKAIQNGQVDPMDSKDDDSSPAGPHSPVALDFH